MWTSLLQVIEALLHDGDELELAEAAVSVTVDDANDDTKRNESVSMMLRGLPSLALPEAGQPAEMELG